MSDNYSAKVIADSISPDGVRLTTLEVVHPRFILAEVNTHRVLSRNSESSRAVPPAKRIELVMNDPFIPVFGSRVKGMGQGDDLDSGVQSEAQQIWVDIATKCAEAAAKLDSLGVDKSHINRVIENFTWHRALITATEWDNFFALRDHPDAQNEFGIIARLMRDALDASDPREIGEEEWHLPLVTDDEFEQISNENHEDPFYGQFVSAGRCARVSYNRHGESESFEKSYDRAISLRNSGHMSPLEHVATPFSKWQRYVSPSNFNGWLQLRKFVPGEANFAELQRLDKEGSS